MSERKRGRRPLLTDEDRELWSHTARSIEPIRRGKPRVLDAAESDSVDHHLSPPRPQLRHETLIADQTATPAGVHQPTKVSRHPASRPPPPLAEFDARTARRIRSGRVEIEARIDLHGMRQNEAHAALRRFLMNAHARGLRSVLVITGKGGPLRRQDGDRGEENNVPLWGHERGILRRNVPRWLAEPELRSIVVSYTTAAIHHGGEGAYYVQIRARR